MLLIIRKDAKLSKKTNFIVQLLSQKLNTRIFYVFKIENKKFKEEWCSNYAQLPSSLLGILTYYLLIMLRSPIEFRNAIERRLSHKKPKHTLLGYGFFSELRSALYINFGTSARADRLMRLLNDMDSSVVFLIDEFISLNCLDLRKLKLLGPIIYVSQDIAHNRYDFANNSVARSLMLRLERNAIANVDLLVACSAAERFRYKQMGAKNVIFYPNIYPTKGFESCLKDEIPSISIVLRNRWGFMAEQALKTIFNALALVDRKIRVYLVGLTPSNIPKNVKLEHYEFIQSKLDYLTVLSKSWMGITVGIHKAGTNERKYDYAEAGTVILSDTLGARGDIFPHEYTYIDSHDLAAKITQLSEFGKARLARMGKNNRTHVLSLAEKKQRNLLRLIDAVNKFTEQKNS